MEGPRGTISQETAAGLTETPDAAGPPGPDTPPADRALPLPALREIVVDALLPALLVRAVLMAFGVLAVIVFRPDALPAEPILAVWDRWDAPHFREIAQLGYGPPADPARIVLLPLFPALMAAGTLVVSPLLAGSLISFGATLVATAGLYVLARWDGGDRAMGRTAVLALVLFPTAFALVAPYSEGLFLAAATWAFVRARRRDWLGAGVLAALAGATRLQGVFLLVALGVEYLAALRRESDPARRRPPAVARDLGALAIGAAGPATYLAINWLTFGNPLQFLTTQAEVFQVRTTVPWEALRNLVASVTSAPLGEFWATVYLAPLAALVVLALATGWSLVGRGSRPGYAAYAALHLVSFSTLTWPISVPRYILTVFPIALAVARLPAWLAGPLLALSTLLLGVSTTLFVIGHWAF